MIVDQVLRKADDLLRTSSTPRLDLELLLLRVLGMTREQLYQCHDIQFSDDQENFFSHLIQQRADGVPIAYLLGRQAFWSLDFHVTPDVLIPRPETELLVELVLERFSLALPLRIADLGTGSGAVALSLASESPCWHIVATDRSEAALAVARANGERLGIMNVEYAQGHWCSALSSHPPFDVIMSNPPYIAATEVQLREGDLRFEPVSALIAEDGGFADLRQIIEQSRDHLRSGGVLFLEHGYTQAEMVRDIFKQYGYCSVKTFCDLANIERVTCGELL